MDIRRRLAYALLIVMVFTAISVAGYRVLGGSNVTFLQALYMAVITLAGVGYGEIIDTSHSPALRVFNMFVVLVGVTITVYMFSVVTAFLVEGEITNIFWRRKMLKRIQALKNHFIVCGLGDTGRFAVEELHKTGTPYVVVEHTEENIKKLQEHDQAYMEILSVIGDATDETTLDQAGIDRAKGLIASLASDKDNLVITVVARQKNPHMRIIARCTEQRFADRLMKAGANSTVSPNRIGGMRMASEALRPHVVGFLDIMLKEHGRTLRIEEIDIRQGSPWIGSTMQHVDLRHKFNLLPLAIRKDDGSFMPNPPDNHQVAAGTVIIVMGDVAELKRARHAASGAGILAATTS